ncbi:hypothetical protein F2Q69_00034135 [Brassica cretica]|uniref:Uncharacterized protein n=1 Tax=Brassica cretica TaxID=69181 RepID=A0A8S9STN1_BRACR|nr:hypothetical protein F2Q69_00034135 [Brassica cretica]
MSLRPARPKWILARPYVLKCEVGPEMQAPVRLDRSSGHGSSQSSFSDACGMVQYTARWTGNASSRTVRSVIRPWFQPKLLSGRMRDGPVHCTVSLSGTVKNMNLG